MSEVHVVGNGPSSAIFTKTPVSNEDKIIACNLPPFTINRVYGYMIVDFKMMRAIREGSLMVPPEWILGFRPKMFCDSDPMFHMQHASKIKEFYTTLPDYVPNYKDFSCGHAAVHYAATKLRPRVIHMYGFDSIFDFDSTSCSDLYLPSSRDLINTNTLTASWRRIWPALWREFPTIDFKLYGRHVDVKIPLGKNVEAIKG